MPDVERLAGIDKTALFASLREFGLNVEMVDKDLAIPGSHWGDEEAGLIRNTLFARNDTPVHSILHEACHWILMDEQRRANLHTDAGGTSVEENAVCYLQLLLADQLCGLCQEHMFRDMDTWGYSFRLGSAREWFLHDAEDAIEFLQVRGFTVPAADQNKPKDHKIGIYNLD